MSIKNIIKHIKLEYIGFIITAVVLILSIVYPAVFYRGPFKLPEGSSPFISYFIICLVVVSFGYFSYRSIRIDIGFNRSIKIKRQYKIRFGEGTIAMVEPISGKGKAIIELDISSAQEPCNQEVFIKVSIIDSDGSEKKPFELGITPTYEELEYETIITDKGLWSKKIKLECSSEIEKIVEINVDVSMACKNGEPYLPDTVSKV